MFTIHSTNKQNMHHHSTTLWIHSRVCHQNCNEDGSYSTFGYKLLKLNGAQSCPDSLDIFCTCIQAPLRREERVMEVQRYGTLNEAIKIRQKKLSILHKTATQLLLPPHTSYYSITLLIHMTLLVWKPPCSTTNDKT